MLIAAFDLSFSGLGFAFGEDILTAHSGVWKLPGADDANLNVSLAQAYSAINACCRANGIEGAVIETALMGIRRENKRGITTPTSKHGDRVLGYLQGTARAAAVNGGVKFISTPGPSTWRAAVFGNGFPENPKRTAVDYLKMLGIVVTDHNRAEALCMMQFGKGKFIAQARLAL